MALLPPHEDAHPLGCQRLRIPDRVVFATRVRVLMVGCASHRIAGGAVPTTTLCRRRGEWTAAGVIGTLLALVLGAHDRMSGLGLDGHAGQHVVSY